MSSSIRVNQCDTNSYYHSTCNCPSGGGYTGSVFGQESTYGILGNIDAFLSSRVNGTPITSYGSSYYMPNNNFIRMNGTTAAVVLEEYFKSLPPEKKTVLETKVSGLSFLLGIPIPKTSTKTVLVQKTSFTKDDLVELAQSNDSTLAAAATWFLNNNSEFKRLDANDDGKIQIASLSGYDMANNPSVA